MHIITGIYTVYKLLFPKQDVQSVGTKRKAVILVISWSLDLFVPSH